MGSWEKLDSWLLEKINIHWLHPALDSLFPLWTDIQKTPLFLFVLLPLILGFTFWRARGRGCLHVLLGALAVSFADLLFGRVVKLWFPRLRPEASALSFEVIVRGPSVGGSSFPSSHAADAFCLAAFLGHFYPPLRWPLVILAGLTAYSRVYCGFHYPGDVLAGAMMGALLGWGLARLAEKLLSRLGKREGMTDA